jgi:iron complex transport system substrate-binding protein
MTLPRVVSTIASATEIVCALGFEGALVGRSHECDFPLSVTRLPVCTNTHIDASQSSADIDRQVKMAHSAGEALYFVDKEVLASVKPDVILTQSHCDVCAVNQREILRAVYAWGGPHPKVVSLSPQTLPEVWVSIRAVAQALDVKARGEALIASLEARLAAVSRKFSPEAAFPRVAYIEWTDPPMAGGNWMPELIRAAGGVSVFGEPGGRSEWVTLEQIVTAEPDLVLIAPCGFDLARTEKEAPAFLDGPEWNALSAARIVLADGNQYFNRPGPRLVDSVELLAEIFHPSAFARRRFPAVWREVERPWASRRKTGGEFA